MNEKMPERIWAGYYIAIKDLPSPIWFDKKPDNNGDLAVVTDYLRSTPERERAGKMKTILKKILKRDTIAGYRQVIRDVLNEIEAEEQEVSHEK